MQLDAMNSLQRVASKPALIKSLEGLATDILSRVSEVEQIRITINFDDSASIDLMLVGAGEFSLGGFSL